jgi:uncharacterized protein YjiS (DUF1127 family)
LPADKGDSQDRRSFALRQKEPRMLDQFKQRFIDWVRYRHTVEVLNHADDQMLADAGIKRHEIRRRARAAVFHK